MTLTNEEKELLNEQVYIVLKCAQPDGFGYINSDLPLKLMKLGYINFNPNKRLIK